MRRREFSKQTFIIGAELCRCSRCLCSQRSMRIKSATQNEFPRACGNGTQDARSRCHAAAPANGRFQNWESVMKRTILQASLLAAAVAWPLAAHAQGTLRGAAEGAEEGGRAGGPVGAIVGGTVGAATGTVEGILGVDDRPRFREYVVRERRPSYRVREEVRVGTVLPEAGVTYYDVPAEYHAPGYRYTIVNERPVIVEPRTRRIVQVID
jgi:hypothetical protein